MMQRNRITVIGHYGMSLLMNVERFPVIGETVEGLDLETEPGGKGYNQAIAAGRLGAEVNFITAVGGDDFGGYCERDLISEGVKGRYIIPFKQEKTACAFVINSGDKNSEVFVYPGAIRKVTSAHIREMAKVIEESKLLLVQNEITEEALLQAIEIAANANVEIIYNPAPAYPLNVKALSKIVCITPNEVEAATLAGLDTEKELDIDVALSKLHQSGARNIVITLGKNGSVVSLEDGTRYQVPPMQVDVVSTTGAGDSFNAAFAVHFLKTHDILESVKYATTASGLQVMRPGVVTHMPYKEETDQYFRKFWEDHDAVRI